MTLEPQIPGKWLVLSGYILPALALLGTGILSIMPINVMGYENVFPPFIYCVIYYWSVFRPSAMPAVLAFVCGIIIDLLIGSTVGVNAFILVAFRWLVSSQGVFLAGQQFIAQWLVYIIVTILGQAAEWGLYSLFSQTLIPIYPVVLGVFFAVALFPLFYGIMHNIHRVIEMGRESP